MREERDHVYNVRGKDDKFFVVIKEGKNNLFYEITWEEWIRTGSEELKRNSQ